MRRIPALAGAALLVILGVTSAQAQYYLPPDKVERNREKLARKQAEYCAKYGCAQQRPGAFYRQAPAPQPYGYAQRQPYGYAPPPRQVYRRPAPPPAYAHDMPGYGYVAPAPRVYRRAPDYYYFDD